MEVRFYHTCCDGLKLLEIFRAIPFFVVADYFRGIDGNDYAIELYRILVIGELESSNKDFIKHIVDMLRQGNYCNFMPANYVSFFDVLQIVGESPFSY